MHGKAMSTSFFLLIYINKQDKEYMKLFGLFYAANGEGSHPEGCVSYFPVHYTQYVTTPEDSPREPCRNSAGANIQTPHH
jgi:hypothetical protein